MNCDLELANGQPCPKPATHFRRHSLDGRMVGYCDLHIRVQRKRCPDNEAEQWGWYTYTAVAA